MKFLISLETVLVNVASVLTVIAQAAEPVIDLTSPGIAAVYNLSVTEAVAFLGAVQASQSPATTTAAATSTAASAAAPASAAKSGPGLAAVTPA